MRLTPQTVKNDLGSKGARTKRLAGFCRSISILCFVGQLMLPLIAPSATLKVTSNGDDNNPGTLRNALAAAANGDTIDASGLSGAITLTNDELLVTNSVTIIGPGPAILEVFGDNGSAIPVFYISGGATVTISGLTITHDAFSTAYPSYSGRGIFNDHSTVTISNCMVLANSDSLGAGIYNEGYNGSASMTIYDSTVCSNEADYGGGIYNDGELSSNTTLTIVGSTLRENVAFDGGGGGILNNGLYGIGPGAAEIAVQDSTFSGNTTAFSGGGIYNDGEEGSVYLQIQNSTFCNNSATYYGGAILNEGDTGGNGVTVINNTILSAGLSGGTIDDVGDAIDNGALIISLGYNLSTDDANGYLTGPGDLISTNPLLGPLQDNGGPTLTHYLATNSPAINAGDPTYTPPPYFDQRGPGFPRIVNGRIDIGAVEFSTAPPLILIQPTNETVTVTKTATLSVSAASTTSPTYQWFKNSAKLAASTRLFGITNNTLTISNVMTTDAGTYFVKVGNEFGVTASSNAVLTVTTPPTNTIIAPTAGQHWSNDVFNVTGTAKDTIGVTNVLFSLNEAGWSNAVTANNWTNWTAGVALTPGTNTIQAYAVDSSGNISKTNTVQFIYVLSGLLEVGTNGEGTVSPNYNGAWLQISNTYTMTATAKTGFNFTNWTDGSGHTLTNKATLTFVMTSNMTFIANFLDVTKPTLTITAPAAGHHMSNALAIVTGTASDNWKVISVWCQLNSNSWNLATSTNKWTNWMAVCKLISGTNTIKAYAIDLGGNFSATNNVSVVSSNSFRLLLNPPLAGNGLGLSLQVSAGLDGRVQVSTNLIDWMTLTNFIGTNSTIKFSDPAASNFNQRFYRAITP